jgi:16S rRNA processing protein RimM
VTGAAQRPTIEQNRGSGGQGGAPEPRFLAVGRVVGAHGVLGELKVELLTDDPHRFDRLELVYVGLDGQEPQPRRLQGCRLHKGRALLLLDNCDDRDTAQAMRGTLIQVPLDEAIPLDEGEYFEHQIVGLEVRTVDGEVLGRVVEILYTGANEVYVVGGPGYREILIPAIDDVVQQVDLEQGQLVVTLLEGLR